MRISESVRKAIRDHAVREYPRESCGLVVSVAGRRRYIPCRNTATTSSEHFLLPAEDYAAAEDAGKVMAVVHSHPNASSAASDADRVACEASGLPWVIISVGKAGADFEFGEINVIKPCGYEAPLIGREFAHGILDCYTLVMDFYARELGIHLDHYDREDDWWHNGGNLYMENIGDAGFEPVVGDPQIGDMILMQIRSPVVNHAGIYLGDGLMLHHLHGRLSERIVYGGYWRDCTRLIVRHKHMTSSGGFFVGDVNE